MAIAILPLVPNIFLAAVSLLILGEGMSTLTFGTSTCANCADSSLKVSVVVFVAIILLVAVVVLFASTAAAGLSNFCMDPEHNTVAYVDFLANNSEVVEQTMEYYLS